MNSEQTKLLTDGGQFEDGTAHRRCLPQSPKTVEKLESDIHQTQEQLDGIVKLLFTGTESGMYARGDHHPNHHVPLFSAGNPLFRVLSTWNTRLRQPDIDRTRGER